MCINGNVVDAIYKDGMKVRDFIMPIYNQRVTFAIGKNMVKMGKKLKLDRDGFDYSQYQGMTIRVKESDGQYRYYLLIEKKKGKVYLTNIVHEIAHFCIAVCEDVGVKTEAWNDEPFAYLSAAVMEQFLDFIGVKDKIKI